MTQLIKTKKTYPYYAQLTATMMSVLLCSYILSVNAGEERPVKTSFAKPSELSVLSNGHVVTTPPSMKVANTNFHSNKRNKPAFSSTESQSLNNNKLLSKVTGIKEKSLALGINLSKELLIRDSEIKWQVKQSGETIRDLEGNHHAVKLPDGLYNVHLQIGKYQQEKQVTLKAGQEIKPYFQMNVGRIQVSADHPVDWKITGPENTVYQINNKQSVNEVLPAGRYQIKATLPALTQQQVVNVQSGKYSAQHLTVPLGKVNLMAIRNNQPLLQAMKWEVFRLEKKGRHKVGEYYLHSKSIKIPPGQYEAVARHQDQTSTRRFWVQKETTNKVVMVME